MPTWEGWGFLAWDQPAGSTARPARTTRSAHRGCGPARDRRGEVGCGFERHRGVVPIPRRSRSLRVDRAGTTTPCSGYRRHPPRPAAAVPAARLARGRHAERRERLLHPRRQPIYFAAQNVIPGSGRPHLPKPARLRLRPQSPCCRSCGQGQATVRRAPTTARGPVEWMTPWSSWDQKAAFRHRLSLPARARRRPPLAGRRRSARQPDRKPAVQRPGPKRPALRCEGQSLVCVAGIVGVPADPPARMPKATRICSPGSTPRRNGGRLQSFGPIQHTWDLILGDPACYERSRVLLPGDAHMIEDWAPRPRLGGPGPPTYPRARAHHRPERSARVHLPASPARLHRRRRVPVP